LMEKPEALDSNPDVCFNGITEMRVRGQAGRPKGNAPYVGAAEFCSVMKRKIRQGTARPQRRRLHPSKADSGMSTLTVSR
jgi:hypothetical protein